MADSGVDVRNYEMKVVLLGESRVGKTALVSRYCTNTFNEEHTSTKKAWFLTKKLNIGGKRVKVNIWDTAGQEEFHALGPIYYRGSDGAVLVYDITDQDSFQKVQKWVKELRKMLKDNICLCIVGNKIDLEKGRTVEVSEAKSYAQAVDARHFQTSAKLNKGVEEMFLDLCKRMVERASQVGTGVRAGTYSGLGSVDIIDDEPEKPADGCCLTS